MKQHEIKLNGVYVARISGRFVNVRVEAIREVQKRIGNDYSGKSEYESRTVYDVLNLMTQRRTTFQSAAKFRSESPSMKESAQ